MVQVRTLHAHAAPAGSATTLPPLLATLQTRLGMVVDGGKPKRRGAGPQIQHGTVNEAHVHRFLQLVELRRTAVVNANLSACARRVTKSELLAYIRLGKRVDTEQAVAMVIGYLASSTRGKTDAEYEEEQSLVENLLADPGTREMVMSTHMWREAQDEELAGNPRELALMRRKQLALSLAGMSDSTAQGDVPNDAAVLALLRNVRRSRAKLGNTQHLVFPERMLSSDLDAHQEWKLENRYSGPEGQVADPGAAETHLLPKRMFRRVQRLLHHMQDPSGPTQAYCLEVERFVASEGTIAPARLAALEKSEDPAAIAYGFIAAQRQRQPRVVSDKQWMRFLVKGEQASVLQNRPNVLTSFEDSLVRRATDLTALTAISCPPGVRDHFSTIGDIKARTRKCCELMEKYVEIFGGGSFGRLVYRPDSNDNGMRGPVDFYNLLVDQVRDCGQRARAAGENLRLGQMYKFLAKDIMAWNNGWKDDAFADGKVPGWVEYLTRVRTEGMSLEDRVFVMSMRAAGGRFRKLV